MSALAVSMPKSTPALRITRLIAWIYVAIATVTTLFTVIQDLVGNEVSVSTPVAQFFPKLNPTMRLDGLTAKMTGGGYDHATFTLAGLHWDARLLLAGGTLLQGATAIVIALTLITLCSRVGAGRPFAGAVERAITFSGVAVLVGGITWQVCFQAGQFLAIDQAFQSTGGQWRTNVKGLTSNSAAWPHAANSFSIDFWPIGIALALFALAAVFRYGAAVERDRANLKRDTEGLV
jgi:hypothetical protein